MQHYLRLNIASPKPYYWDRNAQNWTTDPKHATLFNSDQEAYAEAQHAVKHNDAEVLICVKTRELR